MSFLARLADRLILCPTTDPIDPESRRRIVVGSRAGRFELWSLEHGSDRTPAHPLIILKFPGTGGRAERAQAHPCEYLPGVEATVYAVNPPGYGTSGGRSRVVNIPAVAEASWQYVAEKHPDVPVLVTGTSLGCLAALWAAARMPVAGLLLRNPAPVHQLIRKRWKYNWWNFGLARLVADQVPGELDAEANARRCEVPCLLVTSERDRMAPRVFQDRIRDAYAGAIRQFVIPSADHHDPIPKSDAERYLKQLEWLRSTIFDSHRVDR